MAIGYAFAALICFVLIITIPFGIASLRIALFALWPFGKTVVKRSDAGIASGIGNVIWFVFCGWWLAIGHLVSGVLLCLTIIGIPLGLANLKLIPVSLLPLGREILTVEEARARGMASLWTANSVIVGWGPSAGSIPETWRIAGMSRSSRKRSYASRVSQTSEMVHLPSTSPAQWKINPAGGSFAMSIAALTPSYICVPTPSGKSVVRVATAM